MLTEIAFPAKTRRSQRETKRETKGEGVLRVLTDYCQGLQPGDIVPPHQELAQTFGVSERSVRWALDELSRQGKIVRRQGARTQIAGAVPHLNGLSPSSGQDIAPSQYGESRVVVAIAIPDRALFDQAMQLLVEQAKAEDVSVFCHLIPESGRGNTDFLPPQLPQKPLGFILFRRDLIPLAERLRAAGHRVVLLATPYVDTIPNVPVVHGNQKYGGYIATKHLIELGHRRIGICAYGDWEQTLRAQGHRRALREAARNGIQVDEVMIDLDTLRYETGYAAEVFRGPNSPTGVTVWNDHEAVAVLGQLNRLGLRVPQDVSIVGYDNLPEGQAVHPALTTVYSPMEQQLDAAIDLLTAKSEPPVTHQLIIQPTLISRESCAPAPSGP